MRRLNASCCLLAIAVVGGALALAPTAPAAGQGTAAPAARAAAPANGDRWPKSAELDGATYTIYQPQLDSWDSLNLAAHAAVSRRVPRRGRRLPWRRTRQALMVRETQS